MYETLTLDTLIYMFEQYGYEFYCDGDSRHTHPEVE